MSVLCALSDMTRGSSCGGWNVLVEGFTLQSNGAIHYDAAFVYIVYNHDSRNKFSAHPDETLSACLRCQQLITPGTCSARGDMSAEEVVCTGKHDLWHSFVVD